MARSVITGFVLGVALLVVGGVGAARLLQKDLQKQAAEREYEAAIVDATPVQLGVLTEKQRSHSALYKSYKFQTNGMSISERIAQAQNKVLQMEFHVGIGPVLDPQTPESYFGKLAQESDAIVRGRVTNRVSQVTEDDGFIFTDYEVRVAEVLKNHVAARLNVDATITVTRPGGKIVCNGIVFEVKEDSFAPLPTTNHDVILFLKFIPATGAYQATEATGSFEIDGSNLKPLTGVSFPTGVLQDGDEFLRTARAIIKK